MLHHHGHALHFCLTHSLPFNIEPTFKFYVHPLNPLFSQLHFSTSSFICVSQLVICTNTFLCISAYVCVVVSLHACHHLSTSSFSLHLNNAMLWYHHYNTVTWQHHYATTMDNSIVKHINIKIKSKGRNGGNTFLHHNSN